MIPRRPTRRQLLKTGLAATAGIIAAPFIRPSYAARTLKVSTFGGNFENGFVASVFPEFEKATGIKIVSVSQPGDLQFLIQMTEANRAGVPTVDLCTAAQDELLRGTATGLWHGFDPKRIPNAANLDKRYLATSDKGLVGVGAMAWYETLIVNPSAIKPLPDSWKILWDKGHPNAWGLVSGGVSGLYEITAATWFDGNTMFETEDGILTVLKKIAELKPNVKLWWESEGTMQTAYENDEVIGGMYFYDVANTMAKSGVPVKAIFPKEGGLIDFGSWCQPSASTKAAEAEEFINFMCTPAAQALMTRKCHTAPLIDRKMTDLTDAEFAEVSTDHKPIERATAQRAKHLDFMDAQFTKLLAG